MQDPVREAKGKETAVTSKDEEFPRLRLAAVQAAPVWMDREATVDKACELILEAGRHGADVVGFPENFIPGHPVWFYYHPATSRFSQDLAVELFKNAVEIPSDATRRICTAAARAATNVVVGMTERRPGTTGTLYNTQLFVGRDGTIAGRHRKLVPTVGERLVHAWGDAASQGAVQFDVGPVSGLICGENSNPLAIAALSSQYPFVHVASWPNHFIPAWCGMQETSLLASRNVAYMNKCYVISACGTNSPQGHRDRRPVRLGHRRAHRRQLGGHPLRRDRPRHDATREDGPRFRRALQPAGHLPAPGAHARSRGDRAR